ncbi:MAG: GntR family transcriptional regulator [Spirochaetales bacterium]|uniref:GntR family transcriptional regulator n=1 Tax=Candidatus Thalassospirochaeta sargassi TaxID=3119039 RepID=A0AAJ1MMN6_9SPIO|nr:GntR family transcriptional regulator [Spirochaetales bacterium]
MGTKEVQSYKEKAYDIIKKKIIYCELAPGDVVDKKELIDELGIGRTPIREALSNLEQENLVVIMPRRGVVVSSISINDLSQIYAVREIVEPAMVKLAMPNLNDEDLQRFAEQFKSYDDLGVLDQTKLDSQFHQFLAKMTHNNYIIKLMDNLHSQNQRIRIMTSNVPDRMRHSTTEHLNIIEKLIARDVDGAEDLMRHHISISKKTASTIL